MSIMISRNFSLAELTMSQTAARLGLDNTPDAAAMRNLRTLAAALEQVRSALGNRAIIVSSGYRSPAVNKAIGGSSTSAHMQGLAADFIVQGYDSVIDAGKAVAALGDVPFDQLICEFNKWLHMGLAAPGKKPRRQLLSIGSQKKYVSGLTTDC